MIGYAKDNGGISQQVTHCGGSGHSINSIGAYSSSSECIAVRYTGQDGGRDWKHWVKAIFTSFDADGFTINVTNHEHDLIVIYTIWNY